MSFHYLINFWFLTKKQVHSLFSETFCCSVTYSFIISHKNDKNIKAFIVLGNVMLVTVIVMVATGILIVSVVIPKIDATALKRERYVNLDDVDSQRHDLLI